MRILKHYAEFIFCFNNSGKRTFAHPQFAAGTASNVIDVPPNTTNEYAKEHHATFPVALAGEIISNFTNKSILDLFGGTGTTMVAAEQLGRKCYMMELDPKYVEVIIKRFHNQNPNAEIKCMNREISLNKILSDEESDLSQFCLKVRLSIDGQRLCLL